MMICSIDGCDKPVKKNKRRGWCRMHLGRWERHGDPLVVKVATGPRLKDGIPTYSAIHYRLDRKHGRASEHLCTDCGAPAQDWSYDGTDPNEVHGRAGGSVLAYSLDLDRYVPRCRPCHSRFDAKRQEVHFVARALKCIQRSLYRRPDASERALRACASPRWHCLRGLLGRGRQPAATHPHYQRTRAL